LYDVTVDPPLAGDVSATQSTSIYVVPDEAPCVGAAIYYGAVRMVAPTVFDGDRAPHPLAL
jgi:hypothetical protein